MKRSVLMWLCGVGIAGILCAGSAAMAEQAVTGGAGKTAATPHTAAAPASLAGEWAGTLKVGDAQLHLVLHLSKKGEEWQATMDSLDQAVYAMEVSKVARSGESISFELESVGARFSGTVAADHQSIRGVWEQGGMTLPLRFERRSAKAAAAAAGKTVSKIEGTWQGAIQTGNMRMRLQMHIAHDDKNELIASVDSLDQGIQGIPATRIVETPEGDFRFEISVFSAQYSGKLDAAKNDISGQWSQNGNIESLNFHRSDRPLEVRRPQNPTKPYPYKEEEITFTAGDGKSSLAGTLTLPTGAGPFPAALLIAGSGPTDRDETIASHKPFLVLADLLTRQGVAVLRYDKRGIGQSRGDYAMATMDDYAQDAQAAVAYLKSRKDIDAKRLGVIGHSEGGIVAAVVATQAPEVGWMVLLATPATNGETTLLRQSELIARTGGLPEEQITRSLDFDRQAYAAVRLEKGKEALEKKLNILVEQSGLADAMPPAALQAQIRFMTSPWFRQFLDYDPLPVIQKVQCPVLAMNGDHDLQVDSAQTVPLLRKAYEASGNKDFTVVEVAGVNHLFQTAQSGAPALYGAIEETMAPSVLTAIHNWVDKHALE